MGGGNKRASCSSFFIITRVVFLIGVIGGRLLTHLA